MTKNTRLRIVLRLATCAAILGAASWVAYSALYDRVLKRSEVWHLKVEDVPLTHPQQLRITVDPYQGFIVARSRPQSTDLVFNERIVELMDVLDRFKTGCAS
jgi:hypothetical protein